jgi:radical SAM protein with 4Fe4S-binding SPASM domain
MKVRELSAPLSVQFEITFKCNHKCIFCYNVWKEDKDPVPEEAVDTDTALRIIDNLADSGLFDIIFTGGEPLIHPDFEEISAHAAERHLTPKLSSNGSLITPSVAQMLIDNNFSSIQVSVHASTPELQQFLVGVDTYDRVLRGISAAADEGLHVNVNMTLTQHNLHDVFETAQKVKAVGASSFSITRFIRVGEGKSRWHSLEVDAYQMKHVLSEMNRINSELKMQIQVLTPIPYCSVQVPQSLRSNISRCDGGITWCVVTPSGKVRFCTNLDLIVGDLKEKSMKEIWMTAEPFIQCRNLEYLPEACVGCKYAPLCMGGCKAAAFSKHGKLKAPDPFCLPEKMGTMKGKLTTEDLGISCTFLEEMV